MPNARSRLSRLFHDRRNPLLFERDGDFNPGWLLFLVFSIIGMVGSTVSFAVALVNTKAWLAVVAGLSFTAFAMLCTACIVVPIARAKLLAPALRAAAAGVSQVGSGLPMMPLDREPGRHPDDERAEVPVDERADA